MHWPRPLVATTAGTLAAALHNKYEWWQTITPLNEGLIVSRWSEVGAEVARRRTFLMCLFSLADPISTPPPPPRPEDHPTPLLRLPIDPFLHCEREPCAPLKVMLECGSAPSPIDSRRIDMRRCRFELVCHSVAASNGAGVTPPLPPSARCLSVSSSESHNLRRRSLAVGRRRLVIRWNFAAAAGEAKAEGKDRCFLFFFVGG